MKMKAHYKNRIEMNIKNFHFNVAFLNNTKQYCDFFIIILSNQNSNWIFQSRQKTTWIIMPLILFSLTHSTWVWCIWLLDVEWFYEPITTSLSERVRKIWTPAASTCSSKFVRISAQPQLQKKFQLLNI